MRDDDEPMFGEDDEQEAGETVEIDGDEPDVIDTDDGGAIVTLSDDDEIPGDSDFYANLAETLDEGTLSQIATGLLDQIAKDKQAREKRDQQYEEGIRRTGLGDDAPGGASFEGANKVVHPMLTEACVDFAARAMKEIFPPQGPAKAFIPGKTTDAKLEKADRKVALLNWQLTVQCPEARAEIEQAMTQVPLGGAQYIKLGWDEPHNRPNVLFVAIDDMYLPYAASNFYSAERKTHVQYLTQLKYEQLVRQGVYRDVDMAPVGMEPELSASGAASDRIEGRQQTSYNEDGLRTVYDVYTTMALEDDEDPSPYIVTVDKASGKVLAIYRNWDEQDETREELLWFVELPFIPWRGAYPIGLAHMIGGLSAAATGALRALLDSAHIQNTPSGLKLKGAQIGGQTTSPTPGQIAEIEGGPMVDDIRKLFMAMPFNGPSPVLFNLLGFLVEAGKGVVRTSMEDIADGNPNAPVGTTLAKLEQGAVVYSAIHSRLHDAMARFLRILGRLNGMYLDDERLEKECGEELATREDFDGPLDVVPVSDPNIFSESQRFAQIQAVAQRAATIPGLYNVRKVEERILDTLKIPNAKELLNPAQEPREQNAVNENVAASLGRPITAFPEQDHLAHIQTHLDFMMSPLFGGNPLIAPAFLSGILNHLKEHMVLWYAAEVHRLASQVVGEDIGDSMREIGKDHEARRTLDQLLATAGAAALKEGEPYFKGLPPVIQQAQQLLQQLAPPMPQDPRIAVEQQKVQLEGQKMQQQQQAEAMRAQQEAQQAQADTQLDAAKLQLDAQGMQLDAQQAEQERQARIAIAAQQQQAEDARQREDLDVRLRMNTDDNATAMQIAAAEIASGEHVALKTGTGINPNP